MSDTIFGKIIRGEIPCLKVYEDASVLAFLDINPLSHGHTLVIPKEPAETLDQLSDESAAALGRVLPRICRAVVAATGVKEYNVLENNGSAAHQAFFVRETLRVARKVFISVPHRYFPVEHHTAMPLAHYLDGTFRIACQITGKSEWSQEDNLVLMTRKRLWRIAAPAGRSAAVGYTGLLLGPLSSNLYLALH